MVLSAFAFDTPVVATAVGGLPEYVIPGRTGMLVPAGDAGALAAAIERILRDPALKADLRRNVADAAAHEFHWRHTAETLIASYQAAGRTKH